MSETKGRCRQQLEAWFANNISSVPRYSWMIADAIDRLAADVAAVKDMTQEIALRVPSEFGEDACDAAVRVALKERDAAVRERDEARAIAADVAAVKAKVDAVSPEDVRHFVEAEKAWVALVTEQRDSAIRERDEARAEVERLTARLGDRAEVQQTQLSAAFTEGTLQAGDAMRARFEQVEKERDEARAKVERLNAELAAPAAGWLTEKERRVLADHAQALREQRFALERGGLSSGYSMNPGDLKHQADAINAILARAGLPPVVEVPLFENYAPEVLHLRYRDAISRAGVAWKEVPRE